MGEPRRCVAMIEGCDRCERRTRCDGDCDDEMWHRAGLCSGCGADLDPAGSVVTTRCKYGNCRVYSCAVCGTEKYGDGPVGCRCSTTAFTRFLLNVWWPMTRWLRRRTDA